MSDQAIEQEIQAKGLTAPRITPADIEASVASERYFTAMHGLIGSTDDELPDDLTPYGLITFCVILMENGHKIVGVNTGPVSPSNFDAGLARKLARQHAIDQIWPLMGYALRDRLSNPCG